MNASDLNLLQEADQAIQNASAVSAPTAPAAQTATAAASSWWSVTNAMTMCVALLVFSIIVLGLSTYLLRIGKSGAMVLRVFGTVLVITMATFLVVAGYDDKQIGAPLGLLGTIVGYLLGKDTSSREDRARIEERSD